MTPHRLLASAQHGARSRRALVLDVANPPAIEAFLGAAAAGACTRIGGLRASLVGGGVLALLGPRAPARDEPLAIVISVHVGVLGADSGRDQQEY